MIIAFTGHRNATTGIETLDKIKALYPGATWRHGGAIGFDSQVSDYAKQNNIPQEIIEPDYKQYGKAAPLIRNKAIVNGSALLAACYDGRQTGGTAYTVNLAKKLSVPILLVPIQKAKE